MRPIEECVILVTGSTDGIGRITAEKLARRGAAVLVHGRSRQKCESTLKAIQNDTGNQKLGYHVADLSSLAEARSLAEAIATGRPQLDVLINNAGVGPGRSSERSMSRDGYELLFAVNFLAPFLLTRLLIPVLEKSAPARIVNVSSAAQQRIDFADVMLESSYDPYRAYAQSKLALAMFTFDIAEQLKEKGITANCLHPGSLLDTKMVREGFSAPMGTPDSGADVEVYVATDPGLEGKSGIYFYEKRPARAAAQAYDPEARRKLRELAERLTGISSG